MHPIPSHMKKKPPAEASPTGCALASVVPDVHAHPGPGCFAGPQCAVMIAARSRPVNSCVEEPVCFLRGASFGRLNSGAAGGTMGIAFRAIAFDPTSGKGIR